MDMKKRISLVLLMLCFCILLSACGGETVETDAPEGCLRAGNEATDFTFCYPNTWQIDRNDGMISVKTNVGASGTKAYASISVMAFTLEDKNMGASNFWDKHKGDLTDTYGNKIAYTEEKKELTLDGNKACQSRYSIKLSDVTYQYVQVFCVRYGQVYLLTLTAPEGTLDGVMNGWETVLETFAFEN